MQEMHLPEPKKRVKFKLRTLAHPLLARMSVSLFASAFCVISIAIPRFAASVNAV